MAIQEIPGKFFLPSMYIGAGVPVLVAMGSMAAANSKLAYIFHAPKTGNIASIIWRTATVTTGATIEARLETIDLATGDPSGTLVGTNTNLTGLVVLSTDDNIIFTTTLTAAGAVTQGQLVAFVLVNPPASFGSIQTAAYSFASLSPQIPYHDVHNGTSYTPSASNFKALTLVYDDGTYVTPIGYYPAYTAITPTAFQTGTNPNVRGMRFQFPVSMRTIGLWYNAILAGDCTMRLVSTAYNKGAGTGILASVSIDKDTRGTTAGMLGTAVFDTAVTLSAATNYRLIVEPSTATSVTVYDVSFPSLNVLGTWSGGQNCHLTTANNPTADGDWTNYNSGTFRMPFMGLIIDGIDASAGSSGGLNSVPSVG